MKIFVSWSGQRSQAVAELISDWLKCVIQVSQPWVSTRDIDRGAIWFSEISDILKDVSVGIVCLTQDNKEKPWILFEAGALAKGLTTNRVCTFLIDLKAEDIKDPLAQFNHTTPDSKSVWELTRTINACLVEKALDERILKQVFETYWPQFDQKFQEALENNKPGDVPPPRTEQDILSEILANTRSLTHRIRKLENDTSIKYKSRLTNEFNPSSFDKKAMNMINDMALSGQFDHEQILSKLIDYNMPEDYARELIKHTLLKSNIRVNINNK